MNKQEELSQLEKEVELLNRTIKELGRLEKELKRCERKNTYLYWLSLGGFWAGVGIGLLL